MCESLHCLPNDGGLFQQAPEHVERLLACFRALRKKELADVQASNQKAPDA